MVRKVAANGFNPFTGGGGIRTVDDFKMLLREGAGKISINSSAINNPQLVGDAAQKFGSQCVVVAIDAKKRADGSGWNIYKNGGRIDVGIDAVDWAKKAESLGAGEILLTSMDCDGTKAGYDIELTRTIAESVGIPVIASGGAGTLEHFYDALTEGKADAALADGGVAVLVGAAGIQTVIQMNGPQPLQSDDPVKFRQNAVQIVNDVIPGVGNVAGVQTDAYLPRQFHPVQNFP